ncbi:MAG: helix-turn-helix domain-containing protein [Halobacteriales archaeon]
MQYVDLTIELPRSMQHPMERFLRTEGAVDREELITWNLTPEGAEYALFRVEGDISQYRARIGEVESVVEYTLTAVDDGSFYAYVCQETRQADEQLRAAFARRNLVVVPPISYDDRGMHLTVVGAGSDLTAMVEDVPEPIAVTVESVGDYDRYHGTPVADLTERQLEAVKAAVERGYYAVPREAPLETVADALGCAPSTASTLLRKAEQAVLTRLIAA